MRIRTGLALATAVGLLAAPTAQAVEVLDTIGEPGVGAGGLAAVQGIGVDGNGGLSVAQLGLNRISQFDRNGDFIHAFGHNVIPGGATGFEVCTAATTCGPGAGGPGAGQFSTVWDVAPTAGGESVFATDTGNSRISAFSGDPQFRWSAGYNVIPGPPDGFETCTAATTCQAGVGGIGAGQMANPFGVALAPDSNVQVSDAAGRLNRYTPEGGYVRTDSSPGSGPGSMSAAYGVAVGADGTVAAADTGNHRIVIFNADGAFVRAFGRDVVPGGPTDFEVCTVTTNCKAGTPGVGPGDLIQPTDIAFAPGGTLYVTETGNDRVSHFTVNGQFLGGIGADVIPGGPAGLETCTTATGCQTGADGTDPGHLDTPTGVAVDCRGSFFVAEQGNSRIEKLGEPGTRLAPCPSNDIEIGKAKLNKKKGTAKLPVQIPGPGELLLGGAKVKPQAQAPTVAGEAVLPVKAAGNAKKKLKKKGKVKVTVDVTFTPVNGDPNTESAKVKLKRKK